MSESQVVVAAATAAKAATAVVVGVVALVDLVNDATLSRPTTIYY
jgi:hypothetical protein